MQPDKLRCVSGCIFSFDLYVFYTYNLFLSIVVPNFCKVNYFVCVGEKINLEGCQKTISKYNKKNSFAVWKAIYYLSISSLTYFIIFFLNEAVIFNACSLWGVLVLWIIYINLIQLTSKYFHYNVCYGPWLIMTVIA